MKKHSWILIFLLFWISKSKAQEFQEGYLTFKDSTTILAPILIKINGREYIHYEKKKRKKTKIVRVKKSKLIDFGIIKNGIKESKYAEFRFDVKALHAFYIRNITKDTVHFYLTERKQKVIKGFTQTGEKLILNTKFVSTVFVQEEDEITIYDAINVSPKSGVNKSLFLKRELDGAVRLYPFSIKKVDLIKWLKSFEYIRETHTTENGMAVEIERWIKHETKYDYINGTILIKGNSKNLFLFEEKGFEVMNRLREYIDDCELVHSKIGTKGYQIEDIYLIVKEYNELVMLQKCSQ